MYAGTDILINSLGIHDSVVLGNVESLVTKDKCLTIYFDRAQFIQKFADYYCELNVLHPFREGNGRSTRIFFEQLALHNEYSLDFIDLSKREWIDACIDGFNCDNTKLENIFNHCLQPLSL